MSNNRQCSHPLSTISKEKKNPIGISDLAAYDVSEGKKHLHELSVAKLLRQMINKKITALWSTQGTP